MNELDELRIRESCLDRWGQHDKKIEYFDENYLSYMQALTPQMKDMVCFFLNKFDYYSRYVVNKYLQSIHNKVMLLDGVDIDSSIFCVLKSKRCTINSSYEFLIEYRHLNGISKHSIIPELRDIYEREYWNNIRNLIFIDDFCGSGKTFIDYLVAYYEKIKDKRIVYAIVHIMEESKRNIEDYATVNNLDIVIVYGNSKCAAFEISSYIKDKRECFKEESEKLGLNKDSDIYGFSNSEALASFYNDTPNNTLGIFWKETKENKALFPRNKEKKPGWMTYRDEKRKRKENNYSSSRARYNG